MSVQDLKNTLYSLTLFAGWLAVLVFLVFTLQAAQPMIRYQLGLERRTFTEADCDELRANLNYPRHVRLNCHPGPGEASGGALGRYHLENEEIDLFFLNYLTPERLEFVAQHEAAHARDLYGEDKDKLVFNELIKNECSADRQACEATTVFHYYFYGYAGQLFGTASLILGYVLLAFYYGRQRTGPDSR